jgi:hypothetical protein
MGQSSIRRTSSRNSTHKFYRLDALHDALGDQVMEQRVIASE